MSYGQETLDNIELKDKLELLTKQLIQEQIKIDKIISALEQLDRLCHFAGKLPTGDQWTRYYSNHAPQKIKDLLEELKKDSK